MIPQPRGSSGAPYLGPRGTCLRCGSDAVTHLLIGLLSAPRQHNPPWVQSVGCCHPGYDRECADCGFTWDSHEVT